MNNKECRNTETMTQAYLWLKTGLKCVPCARNIYFRKLILRRSDLRFAVPFMTLLAHNVGPLKTLLLREEWSFAHSLSN